MFTCLSHRSKVVTRCLNLEISHDNEMDCIQTASLRATLIITMQCYTKPNRYLIESKPKASSGEAITRGQVPLHNKNPIIIHSQSLVIPFGFETTELILTSLRFALARKPSFGVLGRATLCDRQDGRRCKPKYHSTEYLHDLTRMRKRNTNVLTKSRLRLRRYRGRIINLPG